MWTFLRVHFFFLFALLSSLGKLFIFVVEMDTPVISFVAQAPANVHYCWTLPQILGVKWTLNVKSSL